MNVKKNKALNITKSQKDFAPDVPEQSVIDTWPKLQRKSVTGQDIAKYLKNTKEALGYVS
ncbi:hypothetical protein AS4_17160 [Acinetobacter guillouiae]|uniref:hypothetical protein n=1 Tax=Acinetobacter guillouiae TaxID=106649 RepID=UPI0004EF67F6|nr:hypothetical protein [Acinetobacter guillouiae]BAP36656.1 hypothetical protein AS4_17160 [Acinetobacter guillouiae]